MKDFILGLQGELKRLQDLQNELNLQAILAGIDVPAEQSHQTQNSSSQASNNNANDKQVG